jgi:hypothetical protein
MVPGCRTPRVVLLLMTTTGDRVRAHALVDELLGTSDEAADRTIAVLNAHAAALAWIREATGGYPAPASVAAALAKAAQRLRTGEDGRDPVAVLGQVAVDALTAHRRAVAA